MNKIKCKKTIKLIHKQADDKLTQMESIILEKHLVKCRLCRERLNSLEKIGFSLKNTNIIPADDFTDKVLNKLPEDNSILQFQKKYFIFPLQWKWVSAGAVVAFLLINYVVFITRVTLENNINFTLKMPEAQTVSLVGDFNDWDINAYKLVRQNGSWKIKLNLPQGRYQYVFVIDGNKWIPDPEAKEYIDNGYGGKNSILDITRL